MSPSTGLNDIAPKAPEAGLSALYDGSGATVDDLKDHVYNGNDEKDVVPDLASYDLDDPDRIIKSGADAAQYMLSDRDDGDPAITVRSMVLGTAFAAFYASISQIYKVSLVICIRLQLISSLSPPQRPLVVLSSALSFGSPAELGLPSCPEEIDWRRNGENLKRMKMLHCLDISSSQSSSTLALSG